MGDRVGADDARDVFAQDLGGVAGEQRMHHDAVRRRKTQGLELAGRDGERAARRGDVVDEHGLAAQEGAGVGDRDVDLTIPGPLQAFLATGDIKNTLLWLVLFVIDMFIMLPFIKAYDKQLLNAEEAGN